MASGTPTESVDMPGGNTPNQNMPEDEESIVQLTQALDHFLRLYQHFLARLDCPAGSPVGAEPDAAASVAAGAVDAGFSDDWVTEDLSVVSLDKPEARLALVSGLVAGIDGNPRGWSPLPTGPRNNVFGPLRLMVASGGEAPDSADTALANVTLLDPDDSAFQLSREKCLEQIIELVRLARLASQARR